MDHTTSGVPRRTAAALAEACRELARDPALRAEYEAWKGDRDAGESSCCSHQPDR